MSDRLTTKQVAQELGYHIKHVQRLLRSGAMRGEKFGRTWIIAKSEIERIKALRSEGGRFYPDKGKENTIE
jgi:excisionase family DNA binding protein